MRTNFPATRMGRRILRTAAALPLLISAAVFAVEENPESAVPAQEIFSTRRTDFFSISAETPDSAAHAAELAEDIERFFEKTPRHWKGRLPSAGTRIDAELFKTPGIFRITADENDRITLFLSENFSDEREMRSRLIEALLAQMFLPRNSARAAAVPPWLVSAAETECALGNVSGRQIFLRKESLKTPPVPPAELISATKEKFASDEIFRINAFWFLRALDDVSVFFDPEKTPEKKLAAAFPRIFRNGEFDEKTADKFWAVRFRELILRANAGADLPEESRQAFDDALLFLVEKNGKENRVLAGDLVRSRLQPEIRQCAADRLAALARHFRQVNPIWHNAFTEYGVFLEMFGDPDVSAETLEAQWDKTVFSRSDAIAIQREIRALLDASVPKLPPNNAPD